MICYYRVEFSLSLNKVVNHVVEITARTSGCFPAVCSGDVRRWGVSAHIAGKRAAL